MSKWFSFVLICFSLSIAPIMHAQCIVINEIMVNGPGPNDGQNSPYTEEWIELYNTCDVAVDMSCFIITDGDFAITIPSGTTIQPSAFYTIGSDNAGFTVNLNWGACGCTSGSSIGVFTNANEQLLLYDDNNTLLDAVYWGSGQFPVTITTVAVGACPSLPISFANPDANFDVLPSGGGQGCSLGLSCDGGGTWVEFCGGSVTGGSSNGGVIPSFNASDTNLCAGDCINFSSANTSESDTFTWTFEGAVVANSSLQNPLSICYETAGTYDVALQVSGACGEYDLLLPDYINVQGSIPDITPNGSVSLCQGQSIELETSATGTLQWQQNGINIGGANAANYVVTSSGDYAVVYSEGNCSFTSSVVEVTVDANLQPELLQQGTIVICDNQPIELEVGGNYISYQWLADGVEIPNATSSTLQVTGTGSYTVEVSNGQCSGVSEAVQVSFNTALAVSVFPDGEVVVCAGQTVLLQAEDDLGSYQWIFNGEEITGATNAAYNASAAGEYAVTVVNENSCTATSDVVNVSIQNITSPEILSANNEFGFCAGESLSLYTNPSFVSYEWFLNGNILNQTTQYITITQIGNYTVQVSDGTCTANATALSIAQYASPTVVVLTNSPLVTCENSAILELMTDDAIQWYANGNLLAAETNETLTVTEIGNYYAVITNSENCALMTESIAVSFEEEIQIEIQTDEENYCEGDVAVLSVAGNFSSIEWSTGQETNSIETTQEGTVEVNVINNIGCEGFATIVLEFSELPLVDAGQDTITDCEAGVLLSGTGEGTLQWLASPSLIDVNDPNTIVNPSANTTYVLTATQNGCTSSDAVLVEADCASIFIPNVFTPNADGKNDVFEIITRGVKEYHLQIFNRWGELLFESNDPNDVWTGGKGGYYVPDGTYMWTVVALDDNNQSLLKDGQEHGIVTVLR